MEVVALVAVESEVGVKAEAAGLPVGDDDKAVPDRRRVSCHQLIRQEMLRRLTTSARPLPGLRWRNRRHENAGRLSAAAHRESGREPTGSQKRSVMGVRYRQKDESERGEGMRRRSELEVGRRRA